MTKILPQVDNMVVVMLENRSLDNVCGWLYEAGRPAPQLFLPPGSPTAFNGLDKGFSNPSNLSFFSGQPSTPVRVQRGTDSTTVPSPDPEEAFDHITFQIYGPDVSNPKSPMQGFVIDYQHAANKTAQQIMQTYTPEQLPVLSGLAASYAISDAWHASVPAQTWPNRSFVHTGTSNGNVNNGDIPDPFQWDVQTIFNVLHAMGESWTVYSDATIAPSLTRTMFPKLWDEPLNGNFLGIESFESACARNALPAYSFIEPCFIGEPNDAHPPHDMEAAEQFLFRIWKAIRSSPGWNNILLIITFDEHGGCYDHVLPPTTAVSPDQASNPGDHGFKFDRYGVRVPAILVSPYIAPGTVFRSNRVDYKNNAVPYDHTSILATLRDWLGIPDNLMLTSKRIASAPTLDQVLTLASPRTDTPSFVPNGTPIISVASSEPPNDLQKSLAAGAARRLGLDGGQVLQSVPARQDIVDFFKLRPSLARR